MKDLLVGRNGAMLLFSEKCGMLLLLGCFRSDDHEIADGALVPAHMRWQQCPRGAPVRFPSESHCHWISPSRRKTAACRRADVRRCVHRNCSGHWATIFSIVCTKRGLTRELR